MLYSLEFFRTPLLGIKLSRLQGESKSSAKEGLLVPIIRRVRFRRPLEIATNPFGE
jgi:hypothetical protein